MWCFLAALPTKVTVTAHGDSVAAEIQVCLYRIDLKNYLYSAGCLCQSFLQEITRSTRHCLPLLNLQIKVS